MIFIFIFWFYLSLSLSFSYDFVFLAAIRSGLLLHTPWPNARHAVLFDAPGRHLQHGAHEQLSLGFLVARRHSPQSISRAAAHLASNRRQSKLNNLSSDQRPVQRSLLSNSSSSASNSVHYFAWQNLLHDWQQIFCASSNNNSKKANRRSDDERRECKRQRGDKSQSKSRINECK